MAGNVKRSVQIPAEVYLVQATSGSLATYLASLSAPSFMDVADTRALWAVEAADAGAGTAESGGTAFIVSKRVYLRSVKGHRYS